MTQSGVDVLSTIEGEGRGRGGGSNESDGAKACDDSEREREERGKQGWWILLNVVHRVDGLLRIVVVGVPNESEATAPTGVTVLNNHLDRRRKSRLEPACPSWFSRRRLMRSGRARPRA